MSSESNPRELEPLIRAMMGIPICQHLFNERIHVIGGIVDAGGDGVGHVCARDLC